MAAYLASTDCLLPKETLLVLTHTHIVLLLLLLPLCAPTTPPPPPRPPCPPVQKGAPFSDRQPLCILQALHNYQLGDATHLRVSFSKIMIAPAL